MLVLLVIIVVIIVGAGVAARLALPSLRQYRGIQNDKRTARLERELHMGDYAVLDNPPAYVPPPIVPTVPMRPMRPLGAPPRLTPAPPRLKVLHIEDIPDVPTSPQPPKKKSLYEQWIDDQ